MNETTEKKKAEPLQLFAMIIMVFVVLAGLYMLNQSTAQQTEILERAITANAEVQRGTLNNIQDQVGRILAAKMKAADAKPAPAAVEPSEDAAEADEAAE